MSTIVAVAAIIVVAAALTLAPFRLPWPARARWMVAMTNVASMQPLLAPLPVLREVIVIDARRDGDGVHVVLATADHRSLLSVVAPDDAVAAERLSRWAASGTTLLCSADQDGTICLHDGRETVTRVQGDSGRPTVAR